MNTKSIQHRNKSEQDCTSPKSATHTIFFLSPGFKEHSIQIDQDNNVNSYATTQLYTKSFVFSKTVVTQRGQTRPKIQSLEFRLQRSDAEGNENSMQDLVRHNEDVFNM